MEKYDMGPLNHFRNHKPDSIGSITIKISYVGANPKPQMIEYGAMELKCNYSIGNDTNKWRTDVSNYIVIIYEEIYSGIFLKYYGNGKLMECDFIVSRGADPSQIAVQNKRVKSLFVNAEDELVIKNRMG